jgi:hypothetical protein
MSETVPLEEYLRLQNEYLGLQAMLAYALSKLEVPLTISMEDLREGRMTGKAIQVIPRDERLELEVSLVDSERLL